MRLLTGAHCRYQSVRLVTVAGCLRFSLFCEDVHLARSLTFIYKKFKLVFYKPLLIARQRPPILDHF